MVEAFRPDDAQLDTLILDLDKKVQQLESELIMRKHLLGKFLQERERRRSSQEKVEQE